ncbi:MAG: hypothetical protein ACYDC6_15685, partial [Acidobacteriaceae bacterium]
LPQTPAATHRGMDQPADHCIGDCRNSTLNYVATCLILVDTFRSGRNFAVDRQIEPLVMDSEISGLENRHAFLKLGNNVARFHFEYMDVPQTTPAFLPRKVEDDELPFDPLTLVRKASPEVKTPIDLETALPPSPDAKATTPQAAVVKNDEGKKEPREPMQSEVAASCPDPDGPEGGLEEDIPVAEPQPMRI